MSTIIASSVRRVPVLMWDPACGFHMAAEFYQRAARYLETAKQDGEKLKPQEALEVAAIDLARRLELSPECVTRVRAVLREGTHALDSELGY